MTFWPIRLLGKLFRMPPPPPPIWRRPKRGANCPPRNCPCPKVSVWTRRNVPSFVKFFDKIKPVSFLSLVDGVKWWLSISKKNTKLLDNLQFWLKNWIRLVGKFYHTVETLCSASKYIRKNWWNTFRIFLQRVHCFGCKNTFVGCLRILRKFDLLTTKIEMAFMAWSTSSFYNLYSEKRLISSRRPKSSFLGVPPYSMIRLVEN